MAVRKKNNNRKKRFIPGKTFIKTGLAIFDQREIKVVIETLEGGRLGLSEKGEELEKKFARYLSCKYSVLTNSGSSASFLALAAVKNLLGLKKGEIITPACGFPTSVNPIIQLGFRPVFVDVDDTLNLTPESVSEAIGKDTVGIIFAHTLGNPARVDKIKELAEKKGIFLIEDCCDAYGSLYMNKKCGSFGTLSLASFYPAHNITLAGEGGAVITNDSRIYRMVRQLRDWGRDCNCMAGQDNRCGKRFEHKLGGVPYDHKYIFSQMGYNLKPTEIQAAFGLEQLKRLEGFNSARRRNCDIYMKRMARFGEFFDFIKIYPESDPVLFGFPLMMKDSRLDRMELMKFLNQHKIGTRFLFGSNLTLQPAYKKADFRVSGDLKYSEKITRDLFWLGCHPGMGEEEIDYIGYIIGTFINHAGNRNTRT